MDEQQNATPLPPPPNVPPVIPLPTPPEKKPINSIDKANEAIDRMQAENDRTEALVERQEALRASEILGGKADAGQAPEPPKKLTDTEYAEAMEKGEADPFKEDGL